MYITVQMNLSNKFIFLFSADVHNYFLTYLSENKNTEDE